ncbi:MAG: peptidase, partial [Nitrosopumilus sp.]|nr:peptidase [Nitrosopumilus sp.]
DGFPFPVKAQTYTHVSSGIPPSEYKFELLEYKENVQQDPFVGITSDAVNPELKDCPKTDSLTNSIQRPTKNFSYQIHAFYAPEYPVQGCPMKWQCNFLSK